MRCFSVGDVILSLSWDPMVFSPFLDPVLEVFAVDEGKCGRSDISFRVAEKNAADLRSYNEIFSVLPGGLWKIWERKEGGSFLISLHDTLRANEPYRFATADTFFARFDIGDPGDARRTCNPLEYPLDEIAIAGHLNINRRGILLHSAMVCVGGNGYLFSGTSGSGKSTLSELWLSDREAEVFTDERVIVREKNGIIYAYGTPWHGTSLIHKNKGAPVQKIFFIRHGSENGLRKISPVDAANRLMVRCFPTFWHKAGMEFALDFCARTASAIKCYELDFLPDQTAISYLKETIEREG
jgi:hypothetical protein